MPKRKGTTVVLPTAEQQAWIEQIAAQFELSRRAPANDVYEVLGDPRQGIGLPSECDITATAQSYLKR
jgi:hypothetical protein